MSRQQNLNESVKQAEEAEAKTKCQSTKSTLENSQERSKTTVQTDTWEDDFG